jgi:hypothetical protein
MSQLVKIKKNKGSRAKTKKMTKLGSPIHSIKSLIEDERETLWQNWPNMHKLDGQGPKLTKQKKLNQGQN